MKKVKLVPFHLDFCEDIYRLSSAPPVKEALGLPDGTVEDTKQFVQKALQLEQEGRSVPRAILNESGHLVGLTELMFIDHDKKSCHVGTWIGHDYWGQGYNEASKLEILSIAFEEVGLEWVFAGARKVNVRSQKAQEKLPFIRLGVEEEYLEEHRALETKEKQACVLNVFTKADFLAYRQQIAALDSF